MKPALFPCRRHRLVLCVWAMFGASLAAAQTAPNAGQVLKDLQTAPLQPAPERKLDLQLPKDDGGETAPAGDGAKVKVAGFAIRGNEAIATDELLALLDDLRGRTLSLGELQAGAARITRHYRAGGYPLARAYLPAQTIEDGVVSIVVLEGRYGEIVVDNGAGLRESALGPLSALRKGEPVRAEALERALLLMNERAGVDTHATLRPGGEVGATDLQVGLDTKPWLSGRIGYDNGGNRYTGAQRLSASLGVNSPLGLGDRFDLQALASEESQHYYALAYQLPVGPYGTSVGAGYSRMDYQLAKNFAYLDAHGTGYSASAFVNQPIVASRAFWLNARLQYDGKRLEDWIDAVDIDARKRTGVVSLTLEGNARDDLFGGGITAFSFGWRSGRLSLLSPGDRASDAVSAHAQGGFEVWQPALVRLQRLDDRFSLFLRVRGQWTDSNLDGSEKLSLGGAQGVRAYPQGEAQGDEGWVGSLELRYALTPQWQLSTFYDAGQVRINHQPWDDSARRRFLGGAGFGASWADDGWRLDLAAAWRTVDSRATSDTHNVIPRVWVQAGYAF